MQLYWVQCHARSVNCFCKQRGTETAHTHVTQIGTNDTLWGVCMPACLVTCVQCTGFTGFIYTRFYMLPLVLYIIRQLKRKRCCLGAFYHPGNALVHCLPLPSHCLPISYPHVAFQFPSLLLPSHSLPSRCLPIPDHHVAFPSPCTACLPLPLTLPSPPSLHAILLPTPPSSTIQLSRGQGEEVGSKNENFSSFLCMYLFIYLYAFSRLV